MPHQCVRCGTIYADADNHIIIGCTCGSRLFYFVRADQLQRLKSQDHTLKNLPVEEQQKIERDIYDIIGEEVDKNLPVILDIESVKIVKQGSYELDVVSLFNKKNPLVYKVEEGKYVIDLASSLKRRKDEKSKNKIDELE